VFPVFPAKTVKGGVKTRRLWCGQRLKIAHANDGADDQITEVIPSPSRGDLKRAGMPAG